MYNEIHQKITEAFSKGTYFPEVYKEHLMKSVDSDVMKVIIEAAAQAALDAVTVVVDLMAERAISYPTYVSQAIPTIPKEGIRLYASYGHVMEMRDDV